MGKFPNGFQIPRYFGDFGGDYSERDTVAPVNDAQAEEFAALLADDAFAAKFDEILKIAYPGEIELKTYQTKDGKKVTIAPAISRYYVLAGYLAIALHHGREKAVLGTYSKEMALAFAKTAKAVGLLPKVCLSRALCADQELVDELNAIGTEVDAVSCTKMLDMPYSYINFDEGMGYEVVPIEANYGIFPRAAMTGLLASIYGQDLKELLKDDLPDAIAVAMHTGTDAIGVMRTFAGPDMKFATVERPVCKEFHTEDSGCYTLVTRTDDINVADTSINPEICYWWRSCKAYRLGADRVLPVDTSAVEDAPIGELGKRALVLVSNALDANHILLVEEAQA